MLRYVIEERGGQISQQEMEAYLAESCKSVLNLRIHRGLSSGSRVADLYSRSIGQLY